MEKLKEKITSFHLFPLHKCIRTAELLVACLAHFYFVPGLLDESFSQNMDPLGHISQLKEIIISFREKVLETSQVVDWENFSSFNFFFFILVEKK